MVATAHSARVRAASLGCGLVLLAVLAMGIDRSQAAHPPGNGAEASMINGKNAKAAEFPWQVALVVGGPGSRSRSARKRYFCSGSLIARDLVITAAHCVAEFSQRQIGWIEAIAGRTWLSNKSGSSAFVKSRLMPRNRNNRFKYSSSKSSPAWDVALLKLKRRLPVEPIELAGDSEADLLSTGTLVKASGWGVAKPGNRIGTNNLRVANQVILPDPVCRRDNGRSYQPKTMICIGGPSGNTSTCFGDSGGPMIARLDVGWRLIGVTSFGDPYCSPNLPSVDARVAGRAIRAWVRERTMRASGVDPVGFGGVVPQKRTWCRVPNLIGRTVGQARAALSRAGCRLGRTRADFYGYGRRGRVSASSLPQGWLTPPGKRIRLWVNR